jgi:hypothetical protein
MEKRVWIGVMIGGLPGFLDGKVNTSLKGLCDEMGVSYSTAVSKRKERSFVLRGRKGDEETMWYVQETRLRKIKGRGSFTS